jgi:hypothetical protein
MFVSFGSFKPFGRSSRSSVNVPNGPNGSNVPNGSERSPAEGDARRAAPVIEATRLEEVFPLEILE